MRTSHTAREQGDESPADLDEDILSLGRSHPLWREMEVIVPIIEHGQPGERGHRRLQLHLGHRGGTVRQNECRQIKGLQRDEDEASNVVRLLISGDVFCGD